MTKLSIDDFLKTPGTTFDVRSPGEFFHAHIPGSINLPLFSNEERAAVGTIYKQQGQKAAIALGLKYVGPKLAEFVSQAEICNGLAKVHCWRGGMRSGAMAWLLDFSGLSTASLKGGYKAFRRWTLEKLSHPYRFYVIGGMTGSGKTAVLHALKSLDEQILDLESFAHHRGSSYGAIGMPPLQPSSEHFENEIAVHLSTLNPERPIWVEDESRMIGTCHLLDSLFHRIRSSPLIVMIPPFHERIERLMTDYGQASLHDLITSTKRIQKHLGGQRTQEVLDEINKGNLRKAIEIVLHYYDAAYIYSLKQRTPVATLSEEQLSSLEWARRLQQQIR